MTLLKHTVEQEAHDSRNRRSKQIIIGSLTGFAGKLITIFTSFAQVPIALHYLGAEQFGFWMLITGVTQFMSFSDMGIGLGLQNRLSGAFGRNDNKAIADYLKTGFILLSAIALALFIMSLVLAGTMQWDSIFNVKEASLKEEMVWTIIFVSGSFALGMPLSLATKYANSIQCSWIPNLWQSIGAVLAFIAVYLASVIHLKFNGFLLMTLLPVHLLNLGVACTLRRFSPVGAMAIFAGKFDKATAWEVFRSGMLFLVPQVCATGITFAPTLAISMAFGPAALTPYNLCQRIASGFTQMLQIPLISLWPAYSEAKAKGDYGWIAKAFRKSIIFSSAASFVAAAAMLIGGELFLKFWTRSADALPPALMLAGFTLMTLITGGLMPVSIILNACGRLKSQATGGLATVALLIPLLYFVVPTMGPVSAVYCVLIACFLSGWPIVISDLLKFIKSGFRG